MKIGVIDSGLGGLTVLKRLIDNNKRHEYIYFGDNFNAPFGNKSKDEIIEIGNKIIEFLESKGVELIILACGTLSSNKEYLKGNVRIIDILSPLNKKLDHYNNISIIATPLSIKTNKFKEYINTNINLISADKLVPIIESNDYSELDNVLKEYLSNTLNSDALLLGCTHYPIIKEYIKKYFKNDIICLDDFICDEVSTLKEDNYSLKIYFSKLDDVVINNINKILQITDLDIERKCLND